ncbi:MAG: alpha/beta hydrolase [Rubrobacteraceae bacterium]
MTQERTSQHPPENEEFWPPASEEPGGFVKAGPYELFVRTAGEPDSPPALFVHGLGGSSGNWTDLMDLLSGRLHNRAVDLPGFGRSEPPQGYGYTLDEHVEAVARLASGWGGPVHLFGHSLGGAIATRVAAENPELVRTLTLISPALPTLRPRGDNALVGILAVPGLGARLMARMRRLPSDRLVADLMERVLYDTRRAPAERVEETIRELEQTRTHNWAEAAIVGSTRGLISAYLTRGPRSLWRQAASIEAPTLLIWGRHDTLVSPTLAGTAEAAIPHSRLLVLGDAGHMAQAEQPVAVARAFSNLLDDLQDGRRP